MSEEAKKDNVNNPQHYCGHTSLECIEVMRVAFGDREVMCFCLCNAFKYLWRFQNKNGEEDINKSKWYLDYVYDYIMSSRCEDDYIIECYNRLNDLWLTIQNKVSKGKIKLK